ncbi:lycopene cyclase family protein [Williamsia deligens]|uniref:Lycopene cyclase family protein n=1 Tax=Williamsia deligens TaxID=321325 RepID=A0ABW3GC06_9NOCA|nr:lycopene cyclase family protein [Williamsia deligens]MCP2195277.1 lycopene beta-cyclase [Williamsia deligens]
MADRPDARHDLVVVGAGPAGRAVAHRAAAAGLDVVVVDPHPGRRWTATYAAWRDELPPWLSSETVASTAPVVSVFTGRRHRIARPYVVLDSDILRSDLSGGYAECAGMVAGVDTRAVLLADGRVFAGSTVIDARGSDPTGPVQTAAGVFVDAGDAAAVLGDEAAVLMDWRDPDGRPLGRPTVGSDGRTLPPTFLYAIPMGDGTVLLEETCLAADPPVPVTELRARLLRRLARTGVDPGRVADAPRESVRFTLDGGGDRPWRPGPTRFGAAGGLMHPATGYSVATSLRLADDVVGAVVDGRDVTDALWPSSARAVHALRRRGLNVILGLDAAATVDFFDGFFQLDPTRRDAYLSERDDLGAVAAAMAALMPIVGAGAAIRIARGAVRRPAWSVPGRH